MTLIQRAGAWRREERAAGRKPTEHVIQEKDVNYLARELLSAWGDRLYPDRTDTEKIKLLEGEVTSGGIKLFGMTVRVAGKERAQ